MPLPDPANPPWGCLPGERGRSLFEGVLRNYPKRLDLWSVYLDQEIAAGEQQRIRSGGLGAASSLGACDGLIVERVWVRL